MTDVERCAGGESDTVCPLCGGRTIEAFSRDRTREYLHCPDCDLVFVPPVYHPTPAAARARYDLHRNLPGDKRYRAYLQRVVTAMLPYIEPGSRGLDFGSGPGPVLALMLEEAGHPMTLYDVHYAPDPGALSATYAFVTATEVLEHLLTPSETLGAIWSCVARGGLLGVMTQLRPDRAAFEHWHYTQDFTHVAFFSVATFKWLGTKLGATVEFPCADVILLHRKRANSIHAAKEDSMIRA